MTRRRKGLTKMIVPLLARIRFSLLHERTKSKEMHNGNNLFMNLTSSSDGFQVSNADVARFRLILSSWQMVGAIVVRHRCRTF